MVLWLLTLLLYCSVCLLALVLVLNWSAGLLVPGPGLCTDPLVFWFLVLVLNCSAGLLVLMLHWSAGRVVPGPGVTLAPTDLLVLVLVFTLK